MWLGSQQAAALRTASLLWHVNAGVNGDAVAHDVLRGGAAGHNKRISLGGSQEIGAIIRDFLTIQPESEVWIHLF